MTMHSERPGTATTDPGNKSAAEIEREVREQRADVERTLDAIQDRLSPGELIDQAVTYVRDGAGGDFFRNLGNSVRHNPMPVALIGVGVAWMMATSGRRDGGPRRDAWVEDDLDEYDRLSPYDESPYAASAYAYGTAPATPSGFNEAGSGPAGSAWNQGDDEHSSALGERARATAAGTKEKADELRRRAYDAADSARSGLEDAKASVGAMGARARAGIARAGHDVSDGARQAQDYARRYGRRARRGFLDTLDEQPLVLGAIGLAVGAVLGSALPSTEREDRLMGDTRDRLKHRAADLGREQMERAQAAAGAAYDAAREEADRQGLTPEGGRSAVEEARHKVERVAEAASSAGKEEAERQGLGKTTG
jgi:Protein of unknown function (DUF3618)